MSVLLTNGGFVFQQIIGDAASKFLKTPEKPKPVIWDVNLLSEEWETRVTTSLQRTDKHHNFSHNLLRLSTARSVSFCSSASHILIRRLCCPAHTEVTRPPLVASRPPLGGPLRRCVGVRWRGGTLRAAVGDCDVRAQQPGREPAWRSQILRGLRGRWERGPGRQHEDRHGALWGRWRYRLGETFRSNS